MKAMETEVMTRRKGIWTNLRSFAAISSLALLIFMVVSIEQRNDASMQFNLPEIMENSKNASKILMNTTIQCRNDIEDSIFRNTTTKSTTFVEETNSTIAAEETNSTIAAEESISTVVEESTKDLGYKQDSMCKAQLDHFRQRGCDMLPKGIVEETSDMERFPLIPDLKAVKKVSPSLLAISVGIKHKDIVDRIVKKFLLDNFTVMLFHYDGEVDGWSDLAWSREAIHISALHQTKWWFAKRFMHPDVVSTYKFIFLWDEDIGVDDFDANRYLNIVEKEGFDISQPALDPDRSEYHHSITVRQKGVQFHRSMQKSRGKLKCTETSIEPACIGWVEMMVPVFSGAAWRCAWHMIQNDLVHGWGIDYNLGYCAQRGPSKRVGIVDEQYVVHMGIPSLGGADQTPDRKTLRKRVMIRRQSFFELEVFRKRWSDAVKEDKCWIPPY